MKRDTNSFQERYNRWKNGENYWDIVDSPLPQYRDGGYYSYMEALAAKKAKERGENEDVVLTEMLNDNTYNYKTFYNFWLPAFHILDSLNEFVCNVYSFFDIPDYKHYQNYLAQQQ